MSKIFSYKLQIKTEQFIPRSKNSKIVGLHQEGNDWFIDILGEEPKEKEDLVIWIYGSRDEIDSIEVRKPVGTFLFNGIRYFVFEPTNIFNENNRKYGVDKFYTGQKVHCSYHFGLIFRPVKNGRVLFKFPFKLKHNFAQPWNGWYGKCDWYYVKFKEYFFPCLIPATCMKDAFQEWDTSRRWLEESNPQPKETDAYNMLVKWNEEVHKYMWEGLR